MLIIHQPPFETMGTIKATLMMRWMASRSPRGEREPTRACHDVSRKMIVWQPQRTKNSDHSESQSRNHTERVLSVLFRRQTAYFLRVKTMSVKHEFKPNFYRWPSAFFWLKSHPPCLIKCVYPHLWLYLKPPFFLRHNAFFYPFLLDQFPLK